MLSETTATIETRTGARQTWRRKPSEPTRGLAWETGAVTRHRKAAALIKAAAAEAPSAVEGGRAVLADDGDAIRTMIYTEAAPVAFVTLAPLRTVALAGQLIAAVLPRLGGRS